MGTSGVLIGTSVHCVGCGKCRGITTVALTEDWIEPEQLPDWPFKEDSCPVCELEKLVRVYPEEKEDKLTARLLKLRRLNQ